MASFDLAISPLIDNEGEKYTNRPHDKGGPTKYGITLKTLQRVRPGATAEDVERLTRAEAVAIYRDLYWPAGYDLISDQRVAFKIFDAGVNSGPRWAIRMAQQAATQIGHACAIDGVWGPGTLAAVEACMPREILLAMAGIMTAHYRAIVREDPTQEENLKGWLARAAAPFHPSALGVV